MKKIKFSALWKCTLAFLIMLSSFSALVAASLINAAEDFSIKEEVSLSEDKASAQITLDIYSVKEAYKVMEIKDSNGEIMDLVSNQGFSVTKNGTYMFQVAYQEKTEEDTFDKETQTYVKEVEITGLVDSERNSKEESSITPTTRSLVSEDGVSIKIREEGIDGLEGEDWDELTGWKNGTVKDVTVKVDFEDDTSVDKKLNIVLPEGLEFVQIPVAGEYNTAEVKLDILNVLVPADPAYGGIQKVTVPKNEKITESTFGEVNYSFTPGTESVSLKFKVRVDAAKYYGPMTTTKSIKASGSKTGASIGQVEQYINMIGAPVGGEALTNTVSVGTEEILPGGVEKSIGMADQFQTSFNHDASGGLGTTNRYLRSSTFYIYYPQGAVYESLFFAMNTGNPKRVIEDQPEFSRIKVSTTDWNGRFRYKLSYSIPEGTPEGILANPEKDFYEAEYYDGEKIKIVANVVKPYEVKVTNQSSIVNQMTLYSYSAKTDNSALNSFSHGANFGMENKTAGKKTNQIYHLEIDPNYRVTRVQFPFDESLVENVTIKNVQYKTNLNSSWRIYNVTSLSDLTRLLPNSYEFDKTMASLDENEFFVEVKAEVGNFSPSFSILSATDNAYLSIYGQLDENATKATIKASMYAKEDEQNTRVSKETVISKAAENNKTMAFSANAIFSNEAGGTVSQVKAGNVVNVTSTFAEFGNRTQYGSVETMQAPEIYIREPKDFKVAVDAIRLVDEKGKDIPFTVSQHTNVQGDTIYILKTGNDIYIGRYFGEDKEVRSLKVFYGIKTPTKAVGSYNIRDLLAWGNSKNVKPHSNSSQTAFVDIYDFNNRDGVADVVFSEASKIITIQENKAVLVETFLGLEGEENLPAYVEGNNSTVAFFTPGTKADYTVKTTNNSNVPADALDIYVPIPKTGINFGINFQKEDFKWDMTLTDAITVPVGFEVMYATDVNADNYKDESRYTTTPPTTTTDKAAIVMVKIRATEPMVPGAEKEMKIPLQINETMPGAENKIGKRNVFNPVYAVDSVDYKGTLQGTKAGTELVISEIGGTVFVDANGDGLYKVADNDVLIEGHEVELYKWNEGTLVYESVLDENNNPIAAKTNANGVYLFDYRIGMGYGNYAVRFVEKSGANYEYTIHNTSDRTIDSDAIISNDIPNPGDTYRGWVLRIDPTKPVAKTIGAGFLKYNPPVDLTVKIDEDSKIIVKVGDAILIDTVITPDFWENIQHPTTPYTWEIVGDAAEKAKASLTDNGNGAVTITPSALASGTTTFDLTLTVKDVYGNTKTSEAVTITVISNTIPTITAADLNIYVGDVVDVMNGISAKDNENNAIALITTGANANVSATNRVPMDESGKAKTAGTYAVEYEVKDQYGNIGTKTRIVKVNALPVLEVDHQVYTQGETGIVANVEVSASASWMKAADTVGAPAVETVIAGPAVAGIPSANQIGYSVSGPSNGFSKEGLYSVTYTAINPDNKSVSKTVKVLIKDAGATTKDGFTINAFGFAVEFEDAKKLTATLTKDANHANAVAFYEDGTTISDVTSSITVDETQLKAINDASNTGGIFNLTFHIADGTKNASKTIQVYVKPFGSISDGDLVLKANSFDIENVNAPLMTAEAARVNAGVSAVLITRDVNGNINGYSDISDSVSVNSGELAAINNVNEAGAVLPLTYSVANGGDSTAKTIQVLVHPAGGIIDPSKTVSINANFFMIEQGDEKALTSNIAKDATHAAVKAYRYIKDAYGNIIDFEEITSKITTSDAEIDAIKAAGNKGGIYMMTFSISESEKSVSKTVTVFVKPFGLVIDPSEVLGLSAENVKMKYTQAASFTKEKATEQAVAQAFQFAKDAGGKTNDVKAIADKIEVDEAQLNAIKAADKLGGIFDLTFSVNEGGVLLEKTIQVFVEPLGTSVDPSESVSISAVGVMIEHSEAAIFNEEELLSKSGAQAFEYIKDANGNIIDFIDITAGIISDATAYADIQNATVNGGIFVVTLSVTSNNVTHSKDVQVFVKPAKGVVDPMGTLVIDGSSIVLTQEEAKALTSATAIEKAKAFAVKIIKDEAGNVVEFEDVTDTIELGQGQLKTINEASKDGGIFDLTLNVSDGDKTANKTVKAVVLGDSTPYPENGVALHVKDANLTYAEAKGITKEKIIQRTEAKAYLLEDGSELDVLINDEQLDAIKTVHRDGATYALEVSADAEVPLTRSLLTNSKTVKVIVDKDPTYQPEDQSKPSTKGNGGISTGDDTSIGGLLLILAISGGVILFRKERA